MNCIKPIIAYDTGRKTANGKTKYYLDLERLSEPTRQGYQLFIGQKKIDAIRLPPYVSFRNGNYYLTKSIELPCGHCIGCTLDKAKEWATRIYLESKKHTLYYFTTLTYNEQHYHEKRNFKRDIQLFMKRLRKNTSEEIRYFAQFEHGEHTGRGHFHLILFFNKEPNDKYRFLKKNANHDYYSSEQIQKAWQMGNDVTVISREPNEAINYVSRYCLKKTGEDGFHMQSQGIGENGKNEITKEHNYFLIHMKGQTHKAKIPSYIKSKLSEELKSQIKEKNRLWIIAKYFEPKPENEKEITGKEELIEEKTRNILVKNKTKLGRKI
nr:replication initiation protein [Microvirus sp.]CAI9752505.1 replication initiation protein [Microvirus sp.]